MLSRNVYSRTFALYFDAASIYLTSVLSAISIVPECVRTFKQNAWQQSVIMNLHWERMLLFPHCLTVGKGGSCYSISKCLLQWLIHCMNIVSNMSPCLRYILYAYCFGSCHTFNHHPMERLLKFLSICLPVCIHKTTWPQCDFRLSQCHWWMVEQMFMKFDTEVFKKFSSHFSFGQNRTNMTDTYSL